MPNNDGEVRVEITGDSSKIKKELKETESAVKNTTESISKMTDALEDKSGSDSFEDIAESAKEAAKAVSNISTTAVESFENITENAEDAEKAVAEVTNETDNLGDSIEDAGQKTITFGDLLKANLLSDYIQKGIGKLADGFWGFLKKGIGLASDLQEVQNVVDTTFGDGAEQIYKWADAAAESFGMSSLQAQNFNGTLGAMLKSMGLTDDAVLKMSTDMVGLAGDMASFHNLDVELAFEKIRAGISGETEPLKQLGINMSVANLEAYALAQGIETAYDKMSQSEQAILRYNYLMSVTADAQGDFAKTSDSFANQQRILQLQAENLSASLGEKLLPSLNKVLQTANDKLPKLENTAENIGEIIGNITEFALENHEAILSLITAYGTFYGVMKAGNAINTAVTAIKSLTTATKAAETAQQGMNAAAAANPYVLLASAVAAVTVGFISLASAAGEASKELKEAAEESVKAYEEQTEKVAGLEKELDDVSKKIEEIQSKGKLNLTDEEELTRLQIQNDKLSTQLEIEKEILETKRQQAEVDLYNAVMSEDTTQKGTIAHIEDAIKEYEFALYGVETYQERLKQAIADGNETLAEDYRQTIANYEQGARQQKLIILEETATLNDLAENLDRSKGLGLEAGAAIDELNEKVTNMFDLSSENPVDEKIEATNSYAEYMRHEGEKKLAEDKQRRADDLADYEKNLKAKVDELEKSLTLRTISEDEYFEQLGEYITKNRNLESDEYYRQLDKYNKYLDKKQDAAEKAAEKLTKEQQDTEKKRIEDSVTALKDRLEADKNYTKEMYYNDLETLISTLDKESDLYKKYNSEILKGRRDLVDAAKKEAQQEAKKLLSEQEKIVEKSLSNILKQFQKAYDELEKKRENYRKKLLSIGGDIFSVDEIENPDGSKTKQYTVNNIEEQIKAMRQYNADIAKLKKQGASSGLLEELTSLSDGDSQQFAKYLSEMSKEEFDKINEAYAEKQRVAEELSKEMYADEYATIADGINTALDEVSADAADKGKEAAESYAKAFGDTLLKHSEDFSSLLDDKTYMKWFGNSGDTSNLFTGMSGDMEKLMKMFMGSNFADIAAKVTSTVRSEQARYSAPAYTAAVGSAVPVMTSSTENSRKSDITAILEKLNKPISVVLDGKVIAETVMTYQGNYQRRTGG